MKLEVTERGADEAENSLIQIGRRAVNVRPAMERAMTHLAHGEKTVLAKARATFDTHKATVERKRRAGAPNIPLYLTGKLQESLTDPNDAMGIRQFIGGDTIRFGTRVHYAKFIDADLVDVDRGTQRSIAASTLRYILFGRI